MAAGFPRTKNAAFNIPSSTSKQVRRLSYRVKSGEQRADRVDVRSVSTRLPLTRRTTTSSIDINLLCCLQQCQALTIGLYRPLRVAPVELPEHQSFPYLELIRAQSRPRKPCFTHLYHSRRPNHSSRLYHSCHLQRRHHPRRTRYPLSMNQLMTR